MLKYTFVTSGTTQLIAEGKTIEVTRIIFNSFFGAGRTQFFEADGTTPIMDVRQQTLNVNDPTEELTTNWLAHKGLSITTSGTTTCTVFYNQSGA